VAAANITQESVETASVFQSNLPLEAKLERARTELLDLSARNRLLSMPRSTKSARILQVVNEQSSEIFRVLVRDNRPMAFLPSQGPEDTPPENVDGESGEIAEMAQPEDEAVNEREVLSRRPDNKLQTRLTPAGLQKRLLQERGSLLENRCPRWQSGCRGRCCILPDIFTMSGLLMA
jgi:hypothetical protein